MKQEWQPYFAADLPGYTSYPTLQTFNDAVGADALERRLGRVGQYEPMAIQIHVPFHAPDHHLSKTKCTAFDRQDRVREYAQLIVRQIHHIGQLLEGRGRLTSLHIAGDAPNVLSQYDLNRILDAVEMVFGLTDSAEVSIDIDPRLVSYETAEAIAALGFTRVVLGVQDFDSDVQRAIGHVQTFSHISEVVSAFRRFGIFDLDINLAYGLPEQTRERFMTSLSLAASLAPDRISLARYNVGAQPHSFGEKEGRPNTLTAPHLEYEKIDMAQRILSTAGYESIGFNQFAKTGSRLALASDTDRLKYGVQGYNADPARFTLGFGQSAISQFDDLVVQNHHGFEGFSALVDADKIAAVRGVILSREDRLRAKIIEDLLCRLNANILDRCHEFDVDLAVLKRSFEKIEIIRNSGLASYKNGKIVIPEEARAISRTIAACFDENLSEITHLSYAV